MYVCYVVCMYVGIAPTEQMTIPLKIVDKATVIRIVGRSFEWMRGSSISKLWMSLAIV